MANYFSYIPDFEYVNLDGQGKSISDYSRVKNLFRRGKLREDIFGNLTFFTKYQITGDDRPDNVAYSLYDDESLDWLILIANNITNVYTEWPMTQQSYYDFLIDKYGSDEALLNVHHYETIEIKNSDGAVIVPAGLTVSQDYSVIYHDYFTNNQVSTSNITVPVTNKEYEDRIEDKKRNIFTLKPEYINVILDDLEEMMTYEKGGTQYVNPTLKRADNIRLFQ